MRQQHFIAVALVLVTTTFSFVLFGQGPPHMRKHQATKAAALVLVPANKKPLTSNRVRITEKDEFRIIESNDIPKHTVGEFPNRGNPNTIAAQNWDHPHSASSGRQQRGNGTASTY